MIAFLLFLIFLVLVGAEGFLLIGYAVMWLATVLFVLGVALLAGVAIYDDPKLQALAGAVLVLAFGYGIVTTTNRKWQESKARKGMVKLALESYSKT